MTKNHIIDSFIKRPSSLLLVIILLTLAAYSNTLHSPTVLDDTNAFLESSTLYLPDLSINSLSSLTQTRFGVQRLIPIATFALNHYFSEGRILDYHLTNIAIHLLTLFFFYLFLTKITLYHQHGSKEDTFEIFPAPLFIALTVGLWALHPVQTNSVTYLVQRMTSLCALFYVSTLTFYLSGRQTNRPTKRVLYFLLSGICGLGALMSKENSFTLPVAIIMLEYFFISRNFVLDILKKIDRRYWYLFLVLILLLLPLTEDTLRNMVLNGYKVREFTLLERVLTESRVTIYYISLLLYPLPSRMNLDHDFTISHSLIDPYSTSLSLLLLVAFTFTIWSTRKSHPLLSFGLLWFFLNLAIESTFIPLEIIFEHRLYLPSMGFSIVLSCIIGHSVQLLRNKFNRADLKVISVVSLILIFSAMSVLTTLRNNAWYNIHSIYEDSYKKSPNKPRTITNLGLAYAKSGDQETAKKYFRESIEKGVTHDEEYITAASNILTSLLTEKKYREAIEEGIVLYKNIPPNPNMSGFSTMFYSLGVAYQMDHQPQLALASYKEALKARSSNKKEHHIYYAISSVLSEIATENFSETDIDQDRDKIEKSYVLENLFYIAVNTRDYQIAKQSLNMLKQIDKEKHKSLNLFLDKITAKNAAARHDSKITNSLLYQNDFRYRTAMNLINFINNHYSPLKFAADKLLDKMKQDYPDDPFVMEKYIGINHRTFLADAANIKIIDELLAKNHNFPPLLTLSAKVDISFGKNSKALKIIDTLLDVYPDHPHWLYWEQTRTKLQMKIDNTDKTVEAEEH